MVSQLTECLAAYKSRIEYQNNDFDVDRLVQHKEIRREMAKLYDDIFEPVCLSYRDKKEITLEKQKLWQIYKEENEKIRKGHVRIQEKIRNIRQNFSEAVVAVEKLCFGYYDKLVQIWGGSASREPLSFGADANSFI